MGLLSLDGICISLCVLCLCGGACVCMYVLVSFLCVVPVCVFVSLCVTVAVDMVSSLDGICLGFGFREVKWYTLHSMPVSNLQQLDATEALGTTGPRSFADTLTGTGSENLFYPEGDSAILKINK